MNRNSQNHFRNVPEIDIKRSKFYRPHTHKTTFDSGKLIPIYVDELLPGDTVQMDMGAAVRMATPIFPVMDNSYIDTYFFYVPYRIIWENFKKFMGDDTTTAWEQQVEYEIPQITAPEGGWAAGTIADYMGIPTNVENISVSSLPFRAYAKIWNEWFRDQNLKDEAMINYDDRTQTGTNFDSEDYDYVISAQLGAEPLPVARYHSYFSSALPNSQKGPDTLLPFGNINGEIPVVGNGLNLGLTDSVNNIGIQLNSSGYGVVANKDIYGIKVGTNSTTNNGLSEGTLGVTTDSTKSGLIALANSAAGGEQTTINMLRLAFGVQRILERDARMGTRYREIIRGKYGVTISDARAQIPEYLGGARHQINIDQVIQTSSTDTTSPQGNTAAYSLTNFGESLFTASFEEPGLIMGLACIRAEEGYQQGIEKFWSRKSKWEFYDPIVANIGEQPIYNKEIYAQGTTVDNEVFGYQEAWADYRYKPNRVSGAFRSNYQGTLDSWHYYNNFAELPTLSSEYIDFPKTNIERTLAVQNEPQFIADFFFKVEHTRPLPVYSVPGLLPHM